MTIKFEQPIGPVFRPLPLSPKRKFRLVLRHNAILGAYFAIYCNGKLLPQRLDANGQGLEMFFRQRMGVKNLKTFAIDVEFKEP